MRPLGSDSDGPPRAAAAPVGALPSACPACQSSSIASAAKRPDATTYWRCEACGEVWNVGRRQAERPGGPRWP